MESQELKTALSQMTDALMLLCSKEIDKRISEIQTEPQVPAGYTDIAGAVAYLGRSEWAIRGLVKRKVLPYYKIDNKVQFKYSELDEYMNRARVKPIY